MTGDRITRIGPCPLTEGRDVKSPTAEPHDTPLTRSQQASIAVRLSAAQAASVGVPEELAQAEVRFAYQLIRRADS